AHCQIPTDLSLRELDAIPKTNLVYPHIERTSRATTEQMCRVVIEAAPHVRSGCERRIESASTNSLGE
ncbi:MAG TPA: hypothetical protein VII92_17345, partial [Anaerolineae bacterium]